MNDLSMCAFETRSPNSQHHNADLWQYEQQQKNKSITIYRDLNCTLRDVVSLKLRKTIVQTRFSFKCA